MLQSALCANYRVKDIVIDSSDRIILIRGLGDFRLNSSPVYAPVPSSPGSVNILNDISSFTVSSPRRYVVDIPNASLTGGSRTYQYKNSVITNVQIAQFSANPDIVRVVVTLGEKADFSKFKTYTNGSDIVIKYSSSVIDNSIQYKFYTPSGDMDKSAAIQNTYAVLSYNNIDDTKEIIPKLRTKYYLSKISQNSDGILLRGLGSISMQKVLFNSDNTTAEIILDNASTASKFENKTYKVPSSQKDISAQLTVNKLNDKKVKLTLNGEGLRDYRFVVATDGQSLYISHRGYLINTIFSSTPAKVNSYKITSAQNGYKTIDFNFDKSITYDVFELNNSFYLDINNLGDYNALLLEQTLKNSDMKVEALKISSDKTRFIIPMDELNFSYANAESNLKSIKLCFKEKPQVSNKDLIKVSSNPQDVNKDVKQEAVKKSENIVVNYVPKEEIKEDKPKKKKEIPTISSMKKVVIDPGHGGSDCGAIGGGYYEKNLNLTVAKMVEERLSKKNIYVYMTRKKDDTLTLEDRVNYSNEINPDIYVSIHTNSTVQEDSYGLETHYYKDDSLELAKAVHKNFASSKNLKKWDTKDRGVIKSRFYVINHTEAPSILIEMGFISNLQERSKLLQKERQEEIADSIVKGILEYLKVK